MTAAKAKAGSRHRASSHAGVKSLATSAANSLDDILRRLDGKVVREIEGIAALIRSLRREIATLESGKRARHRMPAAGQELEAVVSATEAASNRILECAEQVMAADTRDAARYKALVDARMTQIFEACEFQDITGQRIGRIIETLQEIEERVGRYAAADRKRGKSRRKRAGNSQAAIDKLLARRKRR